MLYSFYFVLWWLNWNISLGSMLFSIFMPVGLDILISNHILMVFITRICIRLDSHFWMFHLEEWHSVIDISCALFDIQVGILAMIQLFWHFIILNCVICGVSCCSVTIWAVYVLTRQVAIGTISMVNDATSCRVRSIDHWRYATTEPFWLDEMTSEYAR